MSLIEKIVKLFKRFINWFLNLFRKKKKYRILFQKFSSNQKSVHNSKMGYIVDNPKGSFNLNYPYVGTYEKEYLEEKIRLLKNKVSNLKDQDLEQELRNINDIYHFLDKNISLFVVDDLKELLNNSLRDDLIVDTNSKIQLLRDSICTLINEDLTEYENEVVKRAYQEYEVVNYITVTTLMLDDIIYDINLINEDLRLNKFDKYYFENEVRKIEEWLKRIERLHTKKDVQKEIQNLKNDFYTKKKDKYDLLYNMEIFIDVKRRCEVLLKNVLFKEFNQKKNKKVKEVLESKEVNFKKKEEEFSDNKEKWNDNIMKRFLDMNLAHRLLLLRDKKRLANKENILVSTLNYYQEFLSSGKNIFYFERNKLKFELVKLYNDINYNICSLEKIDYVPLEHINIRLLDLSILTLQNCNYLYGLLKEQYQYDLEKDELSQRVFNKLSQIYENEMLKLEKSNKVLKKDYINSKKVFEKVKD